MNIVLVAVGVVGALGPPVRQAWRGRPASWAPHLVMAGLMAAMGLSMPGSSMLSSGRAGWVGPVSGVVGLLCAMAVAMRCAADPARAERLRSCVADLAAMAFLAFLVPGLIAVPGSAVSAGVLSGAMAMGQNNHHTMGTTTPGSSGLVALRLACVAILTVWLMLAVRAPARSERAGSLVMLAVSGAMVLPMAF